MAVLYKVLNQVAPTTSNLVPLYIVPGTDDAGNVISTISVCNQSPNQGYFSIAVAVDREHNSAKNYIYFHERIDGYRSFQITLGITLGPNDAVRAQSSNGMMSFSIFGAKLIT